LAEFRYIPSPEFHTSRLQQIEDGIRRKLGEDFRMVLREVEEVEKTPSGKHTWLISRL
jgi:phenylacetate-CoA ligase